MHEREFYERLLGLSAPWFVAEVNLDTEAQQVDVFVEHSRGTSFCCPECGKSCPVYDHTAERQWRHLDTMQFKTMLHAKPPRVECPQHGIKQAVETDSVEENLQQPKPIHRPVAARDPWSGSRGPQAQ